MPSESAVLKVGTAWQDVTPSQPLHLRGQMRVRWGERTLDPLTVNTVVFDDDRGGGGGAGPVAVVSCDVCALPDAFVRAVRQRCAARHGLAEGSVLVAATHTHDAPCTDEKGFGEMSPAFMDALAGAVESTVGRALADRTPCHAFAGAGHVEQMGFNRRALRTDGTARMYHGSWNADFAGLEGPRDGAVPVLFARDAAGGAVKAVVVSFATHPNCNENASFYSADIPGAVRRVVRDVLGPDVGVVYFTGAAGNTAPSILADNPDNVQPWRGIDGLRRSGLYLGGEVLKVIAATLEPMADPVVRVARAELSVPLRPWPESLDLSALKEHQREHYERVREAWPRVLAEQSPCPVRLSVVRVGDAAVCTNPGELFVEFGLEIRGRSPARVTMISELTDGHAGYIPTARAFRNGGYETWPSHGSKLDPAAGAMIVEQSLRLLGEAFG